MTARHPTTAWAAISSRTELGLIVAGATLARDPAAGARRRLPPGGFVEVLDADYRPLDKSAAGLDAGIVEEALTEMRRFYR